MRNGGIKSGLKTIIIHKRHILIFLLCLVLVLTSICVPKMVSAHIPKPKYVIVVDAGHGGRDYGCSGVNGTKESEINLRIAKALEKYLKTLDVGVVMTRVDMNGLYAADAKNFKVSDMENRMKIIQKASPNMVVSIHQNSFADHTLHGAQVFYQDDCDESREYADAVQSQMCSILGSDRRISHGDYYLLKECRVPSIIVECGYLTNAEEEAKLNTIEYQNRVAYAIMCGIIKCFGLCGD